MIQSDVERLNPADVLATAERHRTNMVLLIGDAFGRPLANEAASGQYNLDPVKVLYNTGALLSEEVKHQLLRIFHAPGSSMVWAHRRPAHRLYLSASQPTRRQWHFCTQCETFVIADDRKTRLSPRG